MPLIGELIKEVENNTPLKAPSKKIVKKRKYLENKPAEKGAPLEFSAKSRIKNPSILQKHTEKITDPRFSDDFGNYQAENFEKYYGFIEDIERDELTQLQKKQKSIASKRKKRSGKTSDFEHDLIQTIKSKKQRLEAKQKKREQKTVQANRKKEELDLISKGKTPYFEKKTAIKRKNDKRKNMPDAFRRSAN